jgi:hypothetical protein
MNENETGETAFKFPCDLFREKKKTNLDKRGWQFTKKQKETWIMFSTCNA